MLAPRSFLFTRQQPSGPSTPKQTRTERRAPERRNASPTTKARSEMPSTIAVTESRPTTPSSPVVIPMRTKPDPSHGSQRTQTRKQRSRMSSNGSDRSDRRARAVHSPDAIPPSVAALLAITAIPTQKTNTSRRRGTSRQRLTVDAILQHTGETSEKEKRLSVSMQRRPLDFLLTPPEQLEEDDYFVGSENGLDSRISTRTMSSESMPSLDNESMLSPSPSLSSIATPTSRGRRSIPKRQMVSSPSAELIDHPLFTPDLDIEEMDFRVFDRPQEDEKPLEIAVQSRKSAFKSNLTASLRALASAARSSARSLSTLTTPMITPDDFLTRSIISIDPRVPFTDERMPPKLEDTPTPALRRYLNPTTNAPIEAHVPSYLAQTTSTSKVTASIQMQTYKVSRSAKSTSPSVISRRTQSTSEDAFAEVAAGPVARQRDMRENSDFIRIAVMEMAMRKKGKLDDQKPGRARWALPPRKPSTKPYEIGEHGVPVRWIAVTQ